MLDPAFLLPRQGADADLETRADFEMLYLICRRFGVRLVPFPEYWQPVWTAFGRNLEATLSPETKRAVQEIRHHGRNHVPATPCPDATVWRRGFQQLFSGQTLGQDYEVPMAKAVARAVATGEQVVLLSRRMEGRNLVTRVTGNVTLHENTRWLVHLSLPVSGAQHIKCVYHWRNLSELWTTRFDWRLPSHGDGSRYPFVPPDNWWKPSVNAHGTLAARPAWFDANGNGWARPNIAQGAGYHWDVFLTHALEQTIGLDQINIVEFGARPAEGAVGSVHHIPPDKAGHLNDVGWRN